MNQVDIIIDTVKDAKTNVLKSFVQDEKIRKPLQAMVDAEAQLAKEMVKTFESFMTKFKTV